MIVFDTVTRRGFLSGVALATATSVAGCLSAPTRGAPAATFYVGLYHWGFTLFDDRGSELDAIEVPSGRQLTLQAFDFDATAAIQSIPADVRARFPDHEDVEERDEGRIPEPAGRTLEEQREADEDRYPDHGLTVVSADTRRRVTRPVVVPHDATEPVSVTFSAPEPGAYAFVCTVDCGYGHPYMVREQALVVT